MNHRWLSQAVNAALKSSYHQRLGAVIYDKKRIISVGYNQPERSVKNHHPKFRKHSTSIHAEVAAILRARQNLKGMSILVVRLNNNKQFRMARPCDHCMAYLDFVGIKKVTYSINEWPYLKTERI